MDTTTDSQASLVSRVSDVRRVSLGELAGRDADRTDRTGVAFNSSI